MPDSAIHLSATIIGEADSILSSLAIYRNSEIAK